VVAPYVADIYRGLVALALVSWSPVDRDNVGEHLMSEMFRSGYAAEGASLRGAPYVVALDGLGSCMDARPDLVAPVLASLTDLKLQDAPRGVMEVASMVVSSAVQSLSIKTEPGRSLAREIVEVGRRALTDASLDSSPEDTGLLATRLWAMENVFDQFNSIDNESDAAVMDALFLDPAVYEALHDKLIAFLQHTADQRAPATLDEATADTRPAGVLSFELTKLRSFLLSVYARVVMAAGVYGGCMMRMSQRPGLSNDEKEAFIAKAKRLADVALPDADALAPTFRRFATNFNTGGETPLNLRLEDHAMEALCASVLPHGVGATLPPQLLETLTWTCGVMAEPADMIKTTAPYPAVYPEGAVGDEDDLKPFHPDYYGVFSPDDASTRNRRMRIMAQRRVHSLLGTVQVRVTEEKGDYDVA